MAERHTVDVDVVGSKPIRLPEESPENGDSFFVVLLPPFRGDSVFEPHQAPQNKKRP